MLNGSHSTISYATIQLQFELKLPKRNDIFSTTNLFLTAKSGNMISPKAKHILCHRKKNKIETILSLEMVYGCRLRAKEVTF